MSSESYKYPTTDQGVCVFDNPKTPEFKTIFIPRVGADIPLEITCQEEILEQTLKFSISQFEEKLNKKCWKCDNPIHLLKQKCFYIGRPYIHETGLHSLDAYYECNICFEKNEPSTKEFKEDSVKDFVNSYMNDCRERYLAPNPETKKTGEKRENDQVYEPAERTVGDFESVDCVVCLAKKPNTMVLPCSHCVACKECSDELKNTSFKDKCVLCQRKIEHVLD